MADLSPDIEKMPDGMYQYDPEYEDIFLECIVNIAPGSKRLYQILGDIQKAISHIKAEGTENREKLLNTYIPSLANSKLDDSVFSEARKKLFPEEFSATPEEYRRFEAWNRITGDFLCNAMVQPAIEHNLVSKKSLENKIFLHEIDRCASAFVTMAREIPWALVVSLAEYTFSSACHFCAQEKNALKEKEDASFSEEENDLSRPCEEIVFRGLADALVSLDLGKTFRAYAEWKSQNCPQPDALKAAADFHREWLSRSIHLEKNKDDHFPAGNGRDKKSILYQRVRAAILANLYAE